MAVTILKSKTQYEEDPTGFIILDEMCNMKHTDVCHYHDCPHYDTIMSGKDIPIGDDCTHCRERGKFYMQTTYEGMVLARAERNSYNDSDFIAHVWDEKEQKVKEITYGTTRGWSYANGANIDATEEIKLKAHMWKITHLYNQRLTEVVIKASVPDVGKQVRIKSGPHAGRYAEVTWKGRDKFKSNKHRLKVKLKETQQEVFVDSARCMVTNLVKEILKFGGWSTRRITQYHTEADELWHAANDATILQNALELYNSDDNLKYIEAQVEVQSR